MTILYTVGHSKRGMDEFITLLNARDIKTLVDVRAYPSSNRYPHFSEESLRAAMDTAGITYHWAGKQLGGMRKPQPDSQHRALPEGMRGYAEYMETDVFQKAAAQLINMAARTPVAIMCAEREPLDCHRSLIADYLTLEGVQVLHLISPDDVREHQLRVEARRESAHLVYDRNSTGSLNW